MVANNQDAAAAISTVENLRVGGQDSWSMERMSLFKIKQEIAKKNKQKHTFNMDESWHP